MDMPVAMPRVWILDVSKAPDAHGVRVVQGSFLPVSASLCLVIPTVNSSVFQARQVRCECQHLVKSKPMEVKLLAEQFLLHTLSPFSYQQERRCGFSWCLFGVTDGGRQQSMWICANHLVLKTGSLPQQVLLRVVHLNSVPGTHWPFGRHVLVGQRTDFWMGYFESYKILSICWPPDMNSLHNVQIKRATGNFWLVVAD